MIDFRPVGYVIGLLSVAFGATMAIPFLLEVATDGTEAGNFAVSGMIAVVVGGTMALASANAKLDRLRVQQIFLITTLAWLVLPIFGALPFWLGAPHVAFTDAFFESMSGLTTTGSTVFRELESLPKGTLLWRAMLQWFGGVGIIVVAMAFLPALKVGGMQIFRSEAFDTMGKVLPRAVEIASSIASIYFFLTLACALSYLLVGMSPFDAVAHALTTMSTGGFSTYDASFGQFQGIPEYVASAFMVLASIPFVRYVQLLSGTAKPILRDTQVHIFLLTIFGVVAILALYRVIYEDHHYELVFREALFNVTSIMSGTGYASVDYQLWAPFSMTVFFLIGLIGGCAGSTCCSVKIFRYQLLFAAIKSQIMKIYSPHGIFSPRYEGRPVGEDVFSSVMSFFVAFMMTLATVAMLLSLLGLDPITAISGAATALANVGPGLGDIIGPSGNFFSLSDPAKWVLAITMLIGRLELLAVYVLFTAAFWRH